MIRKLNVLVELNGADPVNITKDGDVRVTVLDWDKVQTGVTTTEELISIHDTIEPFAERTAFSIRNELRRRIFGLPTQYANETILADDPQNPHNEVPHFEQ